MPGTSSKDYYSVLGIGREASSDEIKKAFRTLARKFHPDVSKESDSTEKFKEINEAYSVLSDPEKRAKYDRFGTAEGFSAGDFQGGGSGDFSDLGSIFEQFFGQGGGSPFSFSFGGNDFSGPESKAKNIRYRVSVTLEEAFGGTERKIQIERSDFCKECLGNGGFDPKTCKKCGGQGRVSTTRRTVFGLMQSFGTCSECGGRGEIFSKECKECRGSGEETGKHEISVKIPAGVEDGTALRVRGEGELGGDLIVIVSVEENDEFKRKGADLLHKRKISFPTAVLGGKEEFESIDGKVSLEIPKGTETGTVFTLRGRGMPSLRERGRGDLLVKVEINTPKKLSPRELEIIRELSELEGKGGKKGKGFFGL